jgi:hypothetical protein
MGWFDHLKLAVRGGQNHLQAFEGSFSHTHFAI